MKKLYLGNEAVARGLWEAGVTFGSSYPGTPSTEVTEFAATYDEMTTEWAPNEKVAMEAALGASIAGARSFCAMKHVGLNVAADPLFTASYTGVRGGMLTIVADDPGMHSSQNEQDSRHYARAAKVLMLEPADSAECLAFTKLAFDLAERFDTPVLLRLTTRVAHSRSLVTTAERQELPLQEYVKDPNKYVMMPAMAQKRHVFVEERIAAQIAFAEEEAFALELNKVEYHDKKIGIIAAGIVYQYAKEALGESASYLKLGQVYPLPTQAIRNFAAQCDVVYVLEELDDYIEQHCRALGLDVIGKEAFTLLGEYSQALIAQVILGEERETLSTGLEIPGRPPVLCPGCPHRGLFYALKRIGVAVSGDIGCYTLGALPPLGMLDTCICMGASVSALHGRNKANPALAQKSVAVLGDSTFIHSGVTGLINIAYNESNSVVIILDNSITGMTGHQENPTTGKNIKGEPAPFVSLEKLSAAVGIEDVRVVDPNALAETEKQIRSALATDKPAVVISRRPCALLKSVKHSPPLTVDRAKCTGCRACMRIGCPAISIVDGKAEIDATQCVGCGVCAQLCRFGAIGLRN
ncbi:MAG: indolepyruvate ferredoxin oxidoreductase subunit alpha [Oscillospiraceae bacterium]|jgi:indolepyruvate ferredoxin oxidoreductase alpha subunit|nr:indolepyruvate ferredoxin oxidoreductase subunit alpha [Oscillospiraceae bacterium]